MSLTWMLPPISILKLSLSVTRLRLAWRRNTTPNSTRLRLASSAASSCTTGSYRGERSQLLSLEGHQYPARFLPLSDDDSGIPAKRCRESGPVRASSASCVDPSSDPSTSLYVRCSSSCPSSSRVPLLGVSPLLNTSSDVEFAFSCIFRFCCFRSALPFALGPVVLAMGKFLPCCVRSSSRRLLLPPSLLRGSPPQLLLAGFRRACLAHGRP